MDGVEICKKEAKSTVKSIALGYIQLLIKWANKCKWVLVSLFFLFWFIISVRKNTPQLITLYGQGLGKNYIIQYKIKDNINYQPEIDSLLTGLAQALDISKKDSELAKFNRHTCEAFYFESLYLYSVLAKSKEVYNKTQGAFDPTVAPLVDLWEKSLQKGTAPIDLQIQALCKNVGFDYIVLNQKRVKKLKKDVTINLSSVMCSYGIDVISDFLQSKGVKDLCIQLDSKALARGLNSDKKSWQIIHTITDRQYIIKSLSINSNLSDKAICLTRQYAPWEIEQNMRIVIDPRSGYQAQGNIIAAFVLANDCITASAYATAILTKNFNEVLKMLESIDTNIEVFLIYKNAQEKAVFYNSKGLQIYYAQDTQEINLEIKDNSSSSFS